MPKPLTRQQLDEGRCMMEHEHGETCNAGGRLFIHGACHTGAGNEIEYDNGVLHIRCRVCKLPVVDVLVAARTPPPPPPSRVQAAAPRRRRR